MAQTSLFARALFAVIVLPGTMALVLPLLVIAPVWEQRVEGWWRWWGAAPVAIGMVLLGACVREFYVAGKGTLAPWSPPRHLVVSGPFQFSRNPMYVAMMLVLAGWAILFDSRDLGIYAAVMLTAFHARILLGEEPRLAREFGEAWTAYAARVPRWLGGRRQPSG